MDLRLLRVELEEFAEVLGTTCVEYRVRAVSDRLATAEAAQTVGVDGQEIPLRSVESRIKNAAERSRRDALESARLDAIADLNGLRREMLELSHEEVRRLGSPDYATFCRNLSGIDLARLRELTLPILPRSRDMYEEALSWHLGRWAGTSPREARRHDLVRLFRAADLDPVFPADGPGEAAAL